MILSMLSLLLICAAVTLAWQVRLLMREQRGEHEPGSRHARSAPRSPGAWEAREEHAPRRPEAGRGGNGGPHLEGRRRASEQRGPMRHAETRAVRADPWAPFEVRPGMAPSELARQYHRLALLHHPDHGGDARTMAHINGLYGQLRRHHPH